VKRQRTERFRVRFARRTWEFFLLQNVQPGFGAHPIL